MDLSDRVSAAMERAAIVRPRVEESGGKAEIVVLDVLALQELLGDWRGREG